MRVRWHDRPIIAEGKAIEGEVIATLSAIDGAIFVVQKDDDTFDTVPVSICKKLNEKK